MRRKKGNKGTLTYDVCNVEGRSHNVTKGKELEGFGTEKGIKNPKNLANVARTGP